MAARIQVSIDCADPARLVRFWAAALHYEAEDPPGGLPGWNAYWRSVGVPEDELNEASDAGDSIVDPAGVGPRVFFQVVPEAKIVKNRVHLDLTASGGRSWPLATRKERILAEAQRLTAEGATELRVLEQEGLDHFAVVMQDPEGNEFCIN